LVRHDDFFRYRDAQLFQAPIIPEASKQPPERRTMMATIPSAKLIELYETMLRIRLAEEMLADGLLDGEIKCPVHLYTGQEAVAAGVCAHLNDCDYVFGTHRSHGHYLAKGGDLKAMMAEIYGKMAGCAHGRGGSMHLVDSELRIFATPIVGSTIPTAVGTALASSLKGDGAVSVSFFGDGATDEGRFYESLNLAALYTLPVLFICENNFYSTHLPLRARQLADNIYERAEMLGLPGVRVDGNDVCEVYLVAGEAIRRARNSDGPTLIECRTYRWRGHVGPHYDLEKGLRTPEELEAWQARCPLKRLKQRLLSQRILADDDLTSISKRIEREVEEAITFAKASPLPEERDLLRYVYNDECGG
jgi:pyruvate dehydrogenase E1 component alpha subunit